MAVDIEDESFNRMFDVIVACGVFNLRIAGIDDSVRNVTKKLFGLCSESLHMNFLTYYVPQRNVELFYIKPEEILHFVMTEISRREGRTFSSQSTRIKEEKIDSSKGGSFPKRGECIIIN
jgi:hypothetical protein